MSRPSLPYKVDTSRPSLRTNLTDNPRANRTTSRRSGSRGAASPTTCSRDPSAPARDPPAARVARAYSCLTPSKGHRVMSCRGFEKIKRTYSLEKIGMTSLTQHKGNQSEKIGMTSLTQHKGNQSRNDLLDSTQGQPISGRPAGPVAAAVDRERQGAAGGPLEGVAPGTPAGSAAPGGAAAARRRRGRGACRPHL